LTSDLTHNIVYGLFSKDSEEHIVTFVKEILQIYATAFTKN